MEKKNELMPDDFCIIKKQADLVHKHAFYDADGDILNVVISTWLGTDKAIALLSEVSEEAEIIPANRERIMKEAYLAYLMGYNRTGVYFITLSPKGEITHLVPAWDVRGLEITSVDAKYIGKMTEEVKVKQLGAKALARVADIKKQLKGRLKQKGEVRTGDAWQICMKDYSYSSITATFRLIMEEMVAAGKATKIKNGVYKIGK